MAKDFITRKGLGSDSHEPKAVGEVIAISLESNEPLAEAYRQRMPGGLYPHTELCVDLKLLTRKPGGMNEGELLGGAIRRDDDDHYTFIQNARLQRTGKNSRNPFVYRGVRVNIHQAKDGKLYPTFNVPPRFNANFTFKDFCYEAADELCIVGGLMKE